ncbi:MAG: hypothetical protein GC205_09830 [Bacteroidetes bacterium]|nr:hypothetical protein [Bacteroidota bacterium]
MKSPASIAITYLLLSGFILYGFALNLIGSEPYPAIIFPGFREIGSESGTLEFDKPTFNVYAGNRTYTLKYEDILVNIPPANHPTIALHRFRYPNGQGGKKVGARLGGLQVNVDVTHCYHQPQVVDAWQNHVHEAIQKKIGVPADSLVVKWFHYSGKEGQWDITPLPEQVVLNFTHSAH